MNQRKNILKELPSGKRYFLRRGTISCLRQIRLGRDIVPKHCDCDI